VCLLDLLPFIAGHLAFSHEKPSDLHLDPAGHAHCIVFDETIRTKGLVVRITGSQCPKDACPNIQGYVDLNHPGRHLGQQKILTNSWRNLGGDKSEGVLWFHPRGCSMGTGMIPKLPNLHHAVANAEKSAHMLRDPETV
jgi:hypothetical protein